MANDQATFDLNLGGDLKAQAAEGSAALVELQAKIKASQAAVNGYRDQLKALKAQGGDTSEQQRILKGNLDLVKASLAASKGAANDLKDKLGQLRVATKAQADAAKLAADKAKALDDALKTAGGPVQALREKWASLRDAFTSGNGGALLLAGGLGILLAAVVAVTAAAIGSSVAFVQWSIGTADAARSLGLLQEAAAGSAENSAAMTSQIDSMARKVPTARDELQKLYQETYRLGNFSRLSGEAIQSTYEAIAQSSAAMGDQVGKQIGDLITRSKDLGVIRIGRADVQGTGLDYEKDLVTPLAKAMAKTGPVTAKGLNDARLQLQLGGLKLDTGAKLVADAVNARFGSINARQVLSLDVQVRKLKETFVSFTRGINLDPLLKSVQHFFAMFNGENSVGEALKTIVEVLGNGFTGAIAKSGPAAEDFFKSLVIDAQEFIIAALEGKNELSGLFKTDGSELVEDLKETVDLLKDVLSVTGKVAGVINSLREAGGRIKNEDNERAALALQYQAAVYRDAHKGIAGGYKPHEATTYDPSKPTFSAAPANADGGVVGTPAPGEFWASVAPGETIVPKGKGTTSGGGGGRISGSLTVTIIVKSDESVKAAAIVEGMKASSFEEQLADAIEVAIGGLGITMNQPIGNGEPT